MEKITKDNCAAEAEDAIPLLISLYELQARKCPVCKC